jgi:hypothetical protein
LSPYEYILSKTLKTRISVFPLSHLSTDVSRYKNAAAAATATTATTTTTTTTTIERPVEKK